MALDRRTIMGAGVALAAGAGLFDRVSAREAEAERSLRQAAAACGLKFGTAINGAAFASPDYKALCAQECSVITPENALKWQALRPSSTGFSFREADLLFGWARRADLEVRGHTLFWPRRDRLPEWLSRHDFGRKSGEEAEFIVGRHVVTVMERYGARMQSVDVVNEAVDPETGGLRTSVLSQAAGTLEPLMDLAFQASRQIAPNAQLVYNDYMDWGDGSARHREGVLRLLEGFRRRGTPVDALGIQAHVNASADMGVVSRRERDWRDFLDAVTAMGYRLTVTEFDVDDRDLDGDPVRRDAEIAAYAEAYAGLLLDYSQTDAFITWGLSDRYSWLHGFRPRGDGQRKRGCLYDEAFDPKPVRDALIRAFVSAPQRSVRS